MRPKQNWKESDAKNRTQETAQQDDREQEEAATREVSFRFNQRNITQNVNDLNSGEILSVAPN